MLNAANTFIYCKLCMGEGMFKFMLDECGHTLLIDSWHNKKHIELKPLCIENYQPSKILLHKLSQVVMFNTQWHNFNIFILLQLPLKTPGLSK